VTYSRQKAQESKCRETIKKVNQKSKNGYGETFLLSKRGFIAIATKQKRLCRTRNKLWHLFIVFKPDPVHNLQSKTFYIAVVSKEK